MLPDSEATPFPPWYNTTYPGFSERAMIESIEFTNFKALRKTTLPLAPFTLLLGPNGSGKTTVLQAIECVASRAAKLVAVQRPFALQLAGSSVRSATVEDQSAPVQVSVGIQSSTGAIVTIFSWHDDASDLGWVCKHGDGSPLQGVSAAPLFAWLARMQTYTLDFWAIAQPAQIQAGTTIQPNGAGLAAVLDDLKDNHQDRWDSLLAEMRQWLPEYDHILFDVPELGKKAIALRTKKGGHRIPAKDLSQGTLVALALLTLAYLPNPPSLVGLEEIDRGLHPRLLRHLQDALYRLSYPESCGENRPPIQVIATTHSPYLLDLYREHPEEIVLAQKEGLEVQFKRLTDIQHYEEILGESPLSEVWYSGVLGGVSVKP